MCANYIMHKPERRTLSMNPKGFSWFVLASQGHFFKSVFLKILENYWEDIRYRVHKEYFPGNFSFYEQQNLWIFFLPRVLQYFLKKACHMLSLEFWKKMHSDLLKVNYGKTTAMCKSCSKLTIKAPERRQ